MNKVILIANENNQLKVFNNFEENISGKILPLMIYLKGKFFLSEILSFLTVPLIYVDNTSSFDFCNFKALFENDLPKGFTLLVKRVGYSNALEILLNSKIYDAQETYKLRIVNQICTEEIFYQQVSKVSKLSLSAIGVTLKLTNQILHLPTVQAEILERYTFALRFAHPDQKEGMTAFLEKRFPNFSS